VRVAKVTRQRLCRASTALPCARGFAMRANSAVRPESLTCGASLPCVGAFAVRSAFAVRRASAVQLALPCAVVFAVRQLVAVRGTVPCHRPLPWATPQGAWQSLLQHTLPRARSIGCHHVASLPCVCTRQSNEMSFAVCIHTAKAPVFFRILLFFIYACT
jgi:hypothetical protein